MRAVKDSLAVPLKGKAGESEGPRSAAPRRPTWMPFQESESKRSLEGSLGDVAMSDHESLIG